MLINPPLELTDRSFNYGDAVFTTVRVRSGILQYWDLHLRRLEHSCVRLGFGQIDFTELTRRVLEHVSASEQVLKVLVSRGQAGRGYSLAGVDRPCVYITTAALPDYGPWQQHGICMGIATLKLACQPALAGLKHNNRLEQVLLKAELAATDWDDLLVLDAMDRVTEATAANLFFYREGVWHTPTVDQAGVAGVMREHLIQRLQPEQGYYTLEHVLNADAVFICNALMQVVPVRQLAEKNYDLGPVRAVQTGVMD